MATNTKIVQRKADEKRKDSRTRNWTFVVYPDSAPENWRDIIDEEHTQWCVSPLHDMDINPDNTPKKPHYHVLLTYKGLKSYKQIKELTDALNAPIPQKCANVTGMVRYFVHRDNPEKYQYSVKNIHAYGGFDVEAHFVASTGERNELIKQMIDFVKSNNIVHFADLVDFAITEHYYDWYPLLTSNSSYILKEYIKSNWQRTMAYKLNS